MTTLNILLQAGGGSAFQQIIPIALIMIVFYFFMIRPQTKKAKLEKDFKESLKKGDKVVTTGGIHGIIDAVEETTFLLRVDHIRMKIEKSAISAELTKAAQGTDTKA